MKIRVINWQRWNRSKFTLAALNMAVAIAAVGGLEAAPGDRVPHPTAAVVFTAVAMALCTSVYHTRNR